MKFRIHPVVVLAHVLCCANLESHAAVPGCSSSPNGVIGWWPGDGNAADLVGTNSGSLISGADANGVGVVGGAFSFNGTTAYVQIPDSPSLRPTNLTIECWLKFTSLDSTGNAGAGQQYVVFRQNTRSANFEGFALSKERNAGVDQLVFGVSSAGGVIVEARSPTTVVTGAWYHVAGVRGSNFIQIYVNGQMESQAAVNFSQDYGALPLYFGSSGQTYWDRKFSGVLDEVALYNRALSSSEISAIYAAGAAGKCKAVSIESHPQSLTRLAGESASFSVSASGLAPIRYEWRLNGSPIAGQTNAILSIPSVSVNNQGGYAAVVSNALGAVTSQVAVLTVGAPPTITTQPVSRTNIAGSAANFTIIATGSPAPSYQWRFNGAPLPGATGSAYNIGNVQTGNSGNYSATVSNAVGVVTSSVATLTVWAPPSIAAQPASRTNIVGTVASFSVAALGTPAPAYQWRLDGSPVTGATSSVFSIPGVQISDEGVYSVVASNAAGAVVSAGASLTVWAPPFIVQNPLPAEVFEGQSVSFLVAASGTAPMSYQWRLNGTSLVGATNSRYTITNALISQGGAYSAIASNMAGSVTSSIALLTVSPAAPIVGAQPVGGTIAQGESWTFSVDVSGTLPLTYQWMFNGSIIPGATGSSYTITNAQPSQAGDYAAYVANAAGSTDSLEATLVVIPAAVIPDPCLSNAIRCALGKQIGTITIPDMLSLTCLSAANCEMSSLSGLEMAVNLESLQLGHNKLTDLAPLQDLVQLRTLSLENNGIASIMPIAGLSNLTTLSLSQNPITNIEFVLLLRKLETVALCSLGIRNADFLGPLDGLRDLQLRDNIITNISFVANLTALTKLDLRWNEITNAAPLAAGAATLSSIYLGGNGITEVPNLRNLKNLEILSLEHNQITDLTPLIDATNLTYLSAGDNPVADHSPLGALPKLTSLELSAARLTDLSFVTGLHRLRYADFSWNLLHDLSPLLALTNLESLVLAGGDSVNWSQLPQAPALRNLWLHDSGISNMVFVAAMPALRYLNLEKNQISDAFPLFALTNLTGLALGRNPLNDFSPLYFLNKLETLQLHGLCLDTTASAFLWSLPALRFLDLEDNRIADISPVSSMSALSSLYLRKNSLTDLQPLLGLNNLRFIDVRRNSLDLVATNPYDPTMILAGLSCEFGSGKAVCGEASPSWRFDSRTQNESPRFSDIDVNGRLPRQFIPCARTSSIAIPIWDDSFVDEPSLCPKIRVSASSDNLQAAVVAGTTFSEAERMVTIWITNQNCLLVNNFAEIHVVLWDDSGASTSAWMDVFVVDNSPLVQLCPAADMNLLQGISGDSGVPPEQLTPADLLMKQDLIADNVTVADTCVWRFLTNLSSLRLQGATLPALDFLTNLPGLKTLGLTDTTLPYTTLLAGFTNLEHVDFSGTGLTNLGQLPPLPAGIKGLDLARNYLRDISALNRFLLLSELNLQDNRLVDISVLSGLSGLRQAWLAENWMTNIGPLVDLPVLSFLDMRINLVDLAPQSPGAQALFALTNAARPGGPVMVDFNPQRQPRFDIRTNWVVRPGVTSLIDFEMYDIHMDEAAFFAGSTNLTILSSVLLAPHSHNEGTLLVTPAAGVVNGTAVVTITATNDVPFRFSTNVVVYVTPWYDVGSVLSGQLLGWTTAGEKPWFGQARISHDGISSAQSGAVNDLQVSTLETELVGPGTLSFWWKVSSEVDFDILTLTNNGMEVLEGISGEVNWQLMSVKASPGTNRFTWTYQRDKDTSYGLDAAFLDEVRFVPDPFLAASGLTSNGRFRLALQGLPGKTYRLEFSTNLLNWSTMANVTFASQFSEYTDTNLVQGVRFYRLRDPAFGP